MNVPTTACMLAAQLLLAGYSAEQIAFVADELAKEIGAQAGTLQELQLDHEGLEDVMQQCAEEVVNG